MQVLKQCGDDLTRANVMRQVASLHDLVVPMLLPGNLDYQPVAVRADQSGAHGVLQRHLLGTLRRCWYR